MPAGDFGSRPGVRASPSRVSLALAHPREAAHSLDPLSTRPYNWGGWEWPEAPAPEVVVSRLVLPWAVLVPFLAPQLVAQTPYRGVLEWIEFTKLPRTCSSGSATDSVVEIQPAAAMAVVTHTMSCSGSSITLELVAEFPLVTSAATLDSAGRRLVTFEEALRTKFKVTATFNHPGARATALGWAFPIYDIPPNALSSNSNGTCAAPDVIGGARSGAWSVTQSVDCLRNKVHTFGPIVVNGETVNYFQPWANVGATLAWGGTGPVPTDEYYARIYAKAFYRLAPADSVNVTVLTPPAGQRQDPGQVMSNIVADLTYELASQENGALKITVSDQDGKTLFAPAEVQVGRGAGKRQLILGPIKAGRDSREIRLSADLVKDRRKNAAKRAHQVSRFHRPQGAAGGGYPGGADCFQ